MKSSRQAALALLGISVFTLSAGLVRGQSSTQTKSLVNVDSQGVGAHGYDPVAFFTQEKASKGDPQWQSNYGGATYYFESNSNREMFDKEPAKYAPQYGGYCAMAMAMGKLEDSDPNYFVVHEDKLLLQRNEKAHAMFAKDLEGNHKKADANWARLQAAASR
jgi:YHS domain-containing protein